MQRFVRESKTYVEMRRVLTECQVYFVSYYLDGCALDFYNQVVSADEVTWGLEKFFVELFEFCFPTDFCNKQRKRLDRCFQGAKDIAGHFAEWSEIFNTIGLDDSQEKTVKLFNNFTQPIRMEIYHKGFDPEESTWKEVVKAAEQAEILLRLGSGDGQDSAHRAPQTQSTPRQESWPQGHENCRSPSQGGFCGCGGSHGGRFAGLSRLWTEVFRTASVVVPGKGDKYGPMSTQKRNEMLAKGLCFTCNEPRHLARNCPKNNSVNSKKKGRVLVIATHAVRVQSGSAARDALYESMEVLETLHVNF